MPGTHDIDEPAEGDRLAPGEAARLLDQTIGLFIAVVGYAAADALRHRHLPLRV